MAIPKTRETPYHFIMPYAKLRGYNNQSLAKLLNMTSQSLRNKINRKHKFSLPEIELLVDALDVPLKELLKTYI